MNKQGEKMIVAFAIVAVLIIGSTIVYATISAYDTNEVEQLVVQQIKC